MAIASILQCAEPINRLLGSQPSSERIYSRLLHCVHELITRRTRVRFGFQLFYFSNASGLMDKVSSEIGVPNPFLVKDHFKWYRFTGMEWDTELRSLHEGNHRQIWTKSDKFSDLLLCTIDCREAEWETTFIILVKLGTPITIPFSCGFTLWFSDAIITIVSFETLKSVPPLSPLM